MGAEMVDGNACGAAIESSLVGRIAVLPSPPHLAVVIVGDDPASHVYVGAKERACKRLGIRSTRISLDATTPFHEVLATVQHLNADSDVNGILVQSPLPTDMDEIAITDLIDPAKDVDGFHALNLGRLVQGDASGLLPCTPSGVMRMLEWAGIELCGKRVVVIGRSRTVGMPLSLLLAQKGADATVTIAHSRTLEMAELCREADVIIAAVGRSHFLSADWVKPGVVVIDVGVNRVKDDSDKGYHLTGDVHPDVANIASALSPVPGGVGPMTVAMLMLNTVRATEMQQ
ncbi:MAG TPA: bifunctional 5,10-methylenetetrahydrofolate dehydrogenase/5,10-methenyltetrahydrofolate cyclohydrolase [Candidatus Poseidoniales archaeon]|nr:bifunctional 5,10-methylenetetrahydrofolate dehydrogenase/5,10-methenyltetrahydrofolate cyclohydrolase [Candidatus Poseidoniales archaeon]